MKNYILLLIFLSLSCNKNVKKDQISNDLTSQNEESETVDQLASQTEKESFEEFFIKFKDDSIFQISRIKFPLTSIVWELGEEEPTKNQTDKMDWRHWNFYYEENFANREIDAYTQKIKNYGDTMRIEIRGVDNGIFTDYDFVTIDGKWTLISEKDYSN